MCLWEVGVEYELLYLFYLQNKILLIKINTPFGNTESVTIENIKQSTSNGPILCSLSARQYCDTKNSFSSDICIGNYKVGPFAFVDDIADPNSRYKLKQSHANALQFANQKIEFSITKCKVLAINYKCPIENIHIGATPIEQINTCKHLGDWINSKVNYEALVSNRVNDAVRVVSSILSICKEVCFGMLEIDVKLKLYEPMFLSSLLFNKLNKLS